MTEASRAVIQHGIKEDKSLRNTTNREIFARFVEAGHRPGGGGKVPAR